MHEIYKHLIGVEENVNQYNLAEINPIPLTEEWLLKFGFEKSVNDGSYFIVMGNGTNSNGLFLELNNYSCAIGQMKHFSHQFGEYKFVHELQNIYYTMSGQELQLKSQAHG